MEGVQITEICRQGRDAKQITFHLMHSKMSKIVIILGVQIGDDLDNSSSDKQLPTE